MRGCVLTPSSITVNGDITSSTAVWIVWLGSPMPSTIAPLVVSIVVGNGSPENSLTTKLSVT